MSRWTKLAIPLFRYFIFREQEERFVVHTHQVNTGPNSRKKLSEYGQLQEKQNRYGMNERQFATLFKKLAKLKRVNMVKLHGSS